MSYRCTNCDTLVGPKVKMIRHVETRERTYHLPYGNTSKGTEIKREVPLCGTCKQGVDKGIPLRLMVKVSQQQAPKCGPSRACRRELRRVTKKATEAIKLFGETVKVASESFTVHKEVVGRMASDDPVIDTKGPNGGKMIEAPKKAAEKLIESLEPERVLRKGKKLL